MTYAQHFILYCAIFFSLSISTSSANAQDEQIRDLLMKSKLEIYRYLDTVDDINKTLEGNASILLVLAFRGDTDLVAQAIKRGADVTHRDALGRSALWLSVYRRDIETVRLLLSHPSVRSMIDAEDVEFGMSPIFIPFDRNDAEMTMLLLQNGASITIKDKSGSSLSDRCNEEYTPICAVLQK